MTKAAASTKAVAARDRLLRSAAVSEQTAAAEAAKREAVAPLPAAAGGGGERSGGGKAPHTGPEKANAAGIKEMLEARICEFGKRNGANFYTVLAVGPASATLVATFKAKITLQTWKVEEFMATHSECKVVSPEDASNFRIVQYRPNNIEVPFTASLLNGQRKLGIPLEVGNTVAVRIEKTAVGVKPVWRGDASGGGKHVDEMQYDEKNRIFCVMPDEHKAALGV